MKLREADILRTILDYLRVHRIFHFRLNTGAMKIDKRYVTFGKVGAPDIFVVHRGQCLGIEVKGPKGKQSQAQWEFAERLTVAGGLYVVARCIEDVDAKLRQIESARNLFAAANGEVG